MTAPGPLLSLSETADLLRMAPGTLSRQWRGMVATRGLPAPRLGAERGGRPRWLRSQVLAWLDGTAMPANDDCARGPTAGHIDVPPVHTPAPSRADLLRQMLERAS